MDESRKQFEAEVFRRAEVSGYTHMPSVLKKTSDGGYATTWVDMMWEGWQASRSAIEIELPRVIDAHPLGPQSAKMICAFHKNVVGECAESIRAAGIKVKE